MEVAAVDSHSRTESETELPCGDSDSGAGEIRRAGEMDPKSEKLLGKTRSTATATSTAERC